MNAEPYLNMSGMENPEHCVLPSPASIKDWVLKGRIGEITALFESLGSMSPRVDWDPTPKTFEADRLQRLNDYWHGLADGGLPARSAFYPEHVVYVLGNVAVIDLDNDTDSLRYRLFGTAIAERYGADLTGTTVNETGGNLARYFAAAFRAVLAKGRPLYTRHLPSEDSPIRDCQRLILPFGDANGVAQHLVVAHLPFRPPVGSLARTIGGC
jgi:hypothetical protein